MARLYPFRALRPRPEVAAQVAAVPYDVVTVDEAKALADGNPLSFLRVSRPELELPAGTDPYSDAVYERAATNFATLKARSFVVENEPSVYFYRLRMGGHTQTGLAACFSIDEYDRDVIKKHEKTRPDKEDDRTRHMKTLGAQTGPVFLTYRESADVDSISRRAASGAPLFDFEAVDGVRHTIWRVTGGDRDALVDAFARVPALYIADGHHRAASAARARTAGRDGGFLAVAFPRDQVQILPYNRTVKDLGGLTPDAFLQAVGRAFSIEPGPATPARRGDIAMYFNGGWHTLRPRVAPDPFRRDRIARRQRAAGSVARADSQDRRRADRQAHRLRRRCSRDGRARTSGELREGGRRLFVVPVAVADLMAVSDAGAIMPPKSTWFEPKLRDGLLINVI